MNRIIMSLVVDLRDLVVEPSTMNHKFSGRRPNLGMAWP